MAVYTYQKVVNVCLLQDEILAGDFPVLVSISGDVDGVVIEFETVLSTADQDRLDALVAAHDPAGLCSDDATGFLPKYG